MTQFIMDFPFAKRLVVRNPHRPDFDFRSRFAIAIQNFSRNHIDECSITDASHSATDLPPVLVRTAVRVRG